MTNVGDRASVKKENDGLKRNDGGRRFQSLMVHVHGKRPFTDISTSGNLDKIGAYGQYHLIS